MKRPILIALIGYIIGIIWELYLKISIVPFIIILIIIYIVFHYKKFISTNNRYIEKLIYISKTNAILILSASIIISNLITIYSNNKYDNIYKISTEELTYIGTIISNESRGEYKNTYTIKLESINENNKFKNIKLKLNVSNKNNIKLEYGDKIKFIGTYSAPEVQRNYKGFDYSAYLKTLKIYGTVTHSGDSIKIIKKNSIDYINSVTHKISYNIENNIKSILPKKESGLLIGILLGNNEYIDENIKDDFRNSGIYHILAVSGAHMSYVVLGITYLLDRMYISPRKKDILKILGIVFFMLITNNSISVARAGIMGIITLTANIVYRKKDTINTICFSMLIILIYNPYSIQSISFQLSYGGVIGILLLNRCYKRLFRKTKIPNKISSAIAVIMSAQTMIIPIMILNFHTISLTFIFANILITYFIGIIIILGFICAFTSLISIEISSFISIFLNILLKILMFIAEFFGDLPLSKIYITTPSITSVFLYYALISIFSINIKNSNFKHKIVKILSFLLIITFVFNNYIYIPHKMRIHFIDVGQGDSCLIITPNNKKILIDGGGAIKQSDKYDVGNDTLIPYLLNRGIKKLDYIMISHFDADYSMTYPKIAKNIDILSF